jgi:hypothetical protein
MEINNYDPLCDVLVSSLCAKRVAIAEETEINLDQTMSNPVSCSPEPVRTEVELHQFMSNAVILSPDPARDAIELQQSVSVCQESERVTVEDQPELCIQKSVTQCPNIQSAVPTLDQQPSPPDGADVTATDAIDSFINSISMNVEQPVLPNPELIEPFSPNSSAQETATNNNKRQSTRLANKAKSRVGKHTIEIAQDLLSKKLGELSSVKQAAAITDFDSFSQYFDRPLNKNKMRSFKKKQEQDGGHSGIGRPRNHADEEGDHPQEAESSTAREDGLRLPCLKGS